MPSKIRTLRLQKGLTLSDVAKQAQIVTQALSAIETGRGIPWRSLRERLSQIYGVPEEELFEDIDAAQRFLRNQAGEANK